jgi:hypothetical protein
MDLMELMKIIMDGTLTEEQFIQNYENILDLETIRIYNWPRLTMLEYVKKTYLWMRPENISETLKVFLELKKNDDRRPI